MAAVVSRLGFIFSRQFRPLIHITPNLGMELDIDASVIIEIDSDIIDKLNIVRGNETQGHIF